MWSHRSLPLVEHHHHNTDHGVDAIPDHIFYICHSKPGKTLQQFDKYAHHCADRHSDYPAAPPFSPLLVPLVPLFTSDLHQLQQPQGCEGATGDEEDVKHKAPYHPSACQGSVGLEAKDFYYQLPYCLPNDRHCDRSRKINCALYISFRSCFQWIAYFGSTEWSFR